MSFVLDLHVFILMVLVPQRQSELQQSGREGATEGAGETEGSGGGHSTQRWGAGQPANPTSYGPQKPEQTLPRLAGLGVKCRGGLNT